MLLVRTGLAVGWRTLHNCVSRTRSQILCNGQTNRSFSAAYSSPMPETFYNEEQLEMQTVFSKIIENEINPFVDEWEKAEQFPSHELFKKLAKAGLLGVNKPVEYGGLGLSYKYQAAIIEESGTIKCGGIPMAFIVQTDIALPALTNFGSEELKQQFLVPSISGDYVAALAISEPSGGSDVASIKTTAVRQGDDYIINGQKMWITNGTKADWFCLLANTSQGAVHKNKSLICVPANAKGVSRTKIHKIGMHSSDTAQIFLEDVRVPVKNLIGEEGNGFMYQMLQFQDERLGAALGMLKAMDRTISDTIEYTAQRKTFGKPIIDNQYVHFRLAELATENEALRALTYKAVEIYLAGGDVTRFTTMAKLKGARLAREIADTCLQFYGGMGYSSELPIGRLYRDGRLFSIGGGSDEIMLGIICKIMGTLPKANK